MFRNFRVFLCILAFATSLEAQSPPAAVGGSRSLWGGTEISHFCPDWGPSCNQAKPLIGYDGLTGIGFFVDLSGDAKIGAEAEARWLHWTGENGQTQKHYLIGPRYRLLSFGPISANAKVLGGLATINLPEYRINSTYFALAPGVTLDGRVTNRINVRLDYEYQFWPEFENPLVSPSEAAKNKGLNPEGFSLGVQYRFIGPVGSR